PPGRDEEPLPALLASRRGGIWPGRRNRRRCDGTDTAGRCQRGLERARRRATGGRGDTRREVRGREAESGEQKSSGEAPLPREGGHGGKRVASNCLLAADDRFVVAFAKAELKGGCATTRDQAAVEDQVDRFVTGLLDTLTGL